ncbi:phage tail protein [Yersinia ruckeri]|uniref:phage tail protein n=1 Tax=Yersinia ruckeri TaxID=29486 RepID=UPI0030B94F09
MQKIGDIPNTRADSNGEFTDGNVAGGTPPTILPAEWFNTIQRELMSILNAAEIESDPHVFNQVLLSIQKLVSEGIPDLKDASLTQKGIVQLSSSTNSTSQILAATPKAVSDLGASLLKITNNLSEIKNAGQAAVAQTLANLGLGEVIAAAADALKKSANLSDLTNKSASRVNLNVYSRDEVVPAVGGEFRGRVTFPIIAVGGVQEVAIQISTDTEVKVNGNISGPTWTNNQDSLLSTWIRKQITEGNMNKVTAIRRGVVHEVGNSVQAGSFAVTAFVTQGTIFVAELQYQVNGQWIVMGQA